MLTDRVNMAYFAFSFLNRIGSTYDALEHEATLCHICDSEI